MNSRAFWMTNIIKKITKFSIEITSIQVPKILMRLLTMTQAKNPWKEHWSLLTILMVLFLYTINLWLEIPNSIPIMESLDLLIIMMTTIADTITTKTLSLTMILLEIKEISLDQMIRIHLFGQYLSIFKKLWMLIIHWPK